MISSEPAHDPRRAFRPWRRSHCGERSAASQGTARTKRISSSIFG